ncbi:MAG: hypothetical protein LBM27_05320 [Lactobacillaceae bacterium]|jgi:hypothetical protein|nr:hypothetical protein [Lactobacillaceae bacterium]
MKNKALSELQNKNKFQIIWLAFSYVLSITTFVYLAYFHQVTGYADYHTSNILISVSVGLFAMSTIVAIISTVNQLNIQKENKIIGPIKFQTKLLLDVLIILAVISALFGLYTVSLYAPILTSPVKAFIFKWSGFIVLRIVPVLIIMMFAQECLVKTAIKSELRKKDNNSVLK